MVNLRALFAHPNNYADENTSVAYAYLELVYCARLGGFAPWLGSTNDSGPEGRGGQREGRTYRWRRVHGHGGSPW